MANDTECQVEIVELTSEDGQTLFDQITQREMGMSGAEFLKRWDDGEWADMNMDEVPGLVEAWIALPFAR